MIAGNKSTEKIFSVTEQGVDLRSKDGTLEVAFPLTIDLAACLKTSVVTLHCEIIQPRQPALTSTRSVEDFNKSVKQRLPDQADPTQQDTVLFSYEIDVTKLIPNNFVNSVNSTDTIEAIRAKFPPSAALSVDRSEKVKTRSVKEGSQSDLTTARQKRADPGAIRNGSLPLDTTAALSGTQTRIGSLETSARKPDDGEQSKLASASTDKRSVLVNLRTRLTTNQISSSSIRVTARSRSEEIQVEVVKPNFSSLYTLSKVLTQAPSVVGSFTASGNAIVRVTQRDPEADRVIVCYREVKDLSYAVKGIQTNETALLCRPGQTVTVSIPVTSNAIVRVHPASGSVSSPIFGSCFVRKTNAGREKDHQSIASLIAIPGEKGVSINAIIRDANATAGILKRTDLRSGQVTYVTPAPVVAEGLSEFLDDQVSDLSNNEYSVDLISTKGDVTVDAAKTRIKFVRPRGLISASLTLTPVVEGNQLIKISISSSVKSNDVNFLINYIKSSGLDLPFQTDLETLRKSLLNCVKFDVVRFDLRTGDAKFVGQTDAEIVDDIDDVKVASNFLYVCEAFVRSPSQLTDVITDRANQTSSVNPDITRLGLHISKLNVDTPFTRSISTARRNFSRSNFETGTMPAAPSRDSFRDGATGDVFSARVTVRPRLPTVSNAAVSIHDSDPVVTWSVVGDPRMVDRFVVTATSSGATWTAAVASFPGPIQKFAVQDTNDYSRPRYLTYEVFPVYLDGTQGESSTTNEILIDRVREI
jgi:hypothetical protein